MAEVVQAFVGIDLAFAKRKRLPVCVCRWESGVLVPFPLRQLKSPSAPRGFGNAAALDPGSVERFCGAVLQYLADLGPRLGVQISRIAIDAPSAPCCTDSGRRSAELEMDRRGISCFATPTGAQVEAMREKACAHLAVGGAESRLPHANQLWMLVGFELFATLGKHYECIEVFPQATARALGVGAVHKRHREGIQAQLSAAAAYTGWPVPASLGALKELAAAPLHDCLDAYLAAWVASLGPDDREPCGDPPGDVIWIPKVSAGNAG